MADLDQLQQAQLARLESLWQESRTEIRLRIGQRDNYFVRLSLSLAAILVATIQFKIALVMLPMVALYFSILTAHSYQIHKALACYLREDIEPAIKEILRQDSKHLYKEYEEMFAAKQLVGIRAWLYGVQTYLIAAFATLLALVSDTSWFELLVILTSALMCSYWWCDFNEGLKKISS